ncbi:hypothetical protein A9Q99_14475 [Gammaproteobacteria bacterium 45_16_T64]|nr:hypothetical protein A9Q99_14475 [Gammaproteobacteria bacterium 45_16_T64]
MNTPVSHFITVDGTRLHYLSTFDDSLDKNNNITLLLHGWPTSSFLWRNVMANLDLGETVIALDLPGFGQSDKPLRGAYSLEYYQDIISGFLAALGVDKVNLAVHDMGGPVGLYWAVNNKDRLRKIVLLNTLIYPELHWFVKLFVGLSFVPGLKRWMSSGQAIKWTMKLGTASKISDDAIRHYQSAFETPEARMALIKTLHKLDPSKLNVIADGLKELTLPVQIIYGTKDLALPDVAKTMARVKQDLPETVVHVLQGCGHFLQEDEPEEVSRLMGEFLAV